LRGLQQAARLGGDPVNDTGTAGVIARPPLLYVGALLLGLAADHLLPLPFDVPKAGLVHSTIAGLVVVVGLALMAAGIRDFSRGGTPVPTNQPTRTLVTTGTHRWSRNPIYVGMFSFTLASASPREAVDRDPHAASRHHGPLRRRRARGGLLGAALRQRLSDYKSRVRRWL
jgi:protein-S-isoprenylcysteine O-methyltransferase Ste14